MGNSAQSLIYVLLFFVGAYLLIVCVCEVVKNIRKRINRRAKSDAHQKKCEHYSQYGCIVPGTRCASVQKNQEGDAEK